MPIPEIVALAALATLLVVALTHPSGWWEALTALPCALVVVAVGAVSWETAWAQVRHLAPVVAFLVAILVLAEACHAEGLFTAVGHRLGRAAAAGPAGMLRWTFGIAAVVTAVLSLDATVVLLTPVVAAAVVQRGFSARPHTFACARLANSASMLLPVSNLTNLLAFSATGLSFVGFTVAMAPVWLVVVVAEYVLLRRYFVADLTTGRGGTTDGQQGSLPVFPLAVVVATLAGFVLTSGSSESLACVAAAGACVLVVRALVRREMTGATLGRALHLPFAVFVLCLGVVVSGVAAGGLGHWLGSVLPTGDSLGALLAVAVTAMLAANLLNNLPATLLLVPLLTGHGPAPVLAALVGLNVGSGLTLVGSLANLLWRRTLIRLGRRPSGVTFHRLGLVTTPPVLAVAVVVLWGWLKLLP